MEALGLREAKLADATALLRWRNDATTRRASQNTAEISWDDHISWLTSLLVANRPPAIMTYGKAETPCGTIRLSNGELSWVVAPEFRRRGIATRVIRAVVNGIGRPCHAIIRFDNVASIRAAKACGFSCTRHGSEFLEFVWNP